MITYKQITIEWSYPVEINSILQKECMKDIGIYYISRNFGNKQSILYIGKTTYNFWSRIDSHKTYWIDTYRGKKYVRLGRIVRPSNISTKSTNFDNNLKISNIGYRGQLPKVLYIPDEWLEEYDENTGNSRYKKKST